MIVRPFIRVNQKQIICFTYKLKKYSCNPRVITEYLLQNHENEFKIIWAFDKSINISNIDPRIHVVRLFSIEYIKALYSSKYVIYNMRNNPMLTLFIKRKKQKYIMTWHSSMRLKKIEKDAIKQLNKKYEKRAISDSKMCDLMFSNSKLFSNLIRSSFWYQGEILERCIPRNDIYYNETYKNSSYTNVRKSLNFSSDSKIVLYAPTFRKDKNNFQYYKLNYDALLPAFERILGGNVEILVRMHPNMMDNSQISTITNHPHVWDITSAPDITEYLFAADLIVSDYSSVIFDSIILNKPCFIYAIDYKTYDRGFYWNFDQLPFPFSKNEKELIHNIESFNQDNYNQKIADFRNNVWQLDEDGHSCERFYKWLINN